MVTDLHTRLRSAIEERLALAERASVRLSANERWRFDGTSSISPRLVVGPDDQQDVWTRECNPSVWTCNDELDGCPEAARGYTAEGEHMAANDPAWTIRACRADLARLDEHQPRLIPGSAQIYRCSYDWDGGEGRTTLWPCPEVRSLAEVWLEESV